MEKMEESQNENISFLEKNGIETEGKSSAYIVTFTPYFKNIAKKEIEQFDPSVKFEKFITDGLVLATSKKTNEEFVGRISKDTPIFTKHIMPIMGAGEVEGVLDEDRVRLLEVVDSITEMEEKEKFAVQCRVVSGGLPYSAKDIEVYIGNSYYERGFIPSFSDRDIINDDIHIISILIHEIFFYVGFSKSTENLNFHSDEHRIRARAGKREISRAESKLVEALSTFKVELDGCGTALDLGAAPGGWSKVLADYGYKVLAVDPASLHPDLEKDTRIEHMKIKAQDTELDEQLDLIVNDMNMDPKDAAVIMNEVAHLLKENGLAIMTLKLPGHAERSIQEGVELLEKEYDVLKIRSLSHNRQEVTALLKKKKK
jgi:23S rRNA (cytidine2498-2'-O)-methyltransferase